LTALDFRPGVGGFAGDASSLEFDSVRRSPYPAVEHLFATFPDPGA
jgi:hypothetical protein